MKFEASLSRNEIEQWFRYFNPILDQGCWPWLIAFVKELSQSNQNNSKLIQLESLGERYGKYNNYKVEYA